MSKIIGVFARDPAFYITRKIKRRRQASELKRHWSQVERHNPLRHVTDKDKKIVKTNKPIPFNEYHRRREEHERRQQA